MTTKNSTQLKKVTGLQAVPFVTADAAAGVDGYVVSEDGLTALVDASFVAETVPTLTTERDNAVVAQQLAERNLATATTTITANNTRITELETQLAEALEGNDEFEEKPRANDPNAKNKVPFHASSKDPSNVIADALFGAPVEKKDK